MFSYIFLNAAEGAWWILNLETSVDDRASWKNIPWEFLHKQLMTLMNFCSP